MKHSAKWDWKGTWKSDRKLVPIFICICVLITAVGIFFLKFQYLFIKDSSSPVVISEIMAENTSAYPASDGGYYPWIELYNNSDGNADLSGMKLGSTYDIRGAADLPAVTLEPDERVVVYLTETQIDGAVSIPVTLSKNGDSLYLFDNNGKVSQCVSVPSMGKNRSAYPDDVTGEWIVTEMYTPGTENTEEGYEKVLETLSCASTVQFNEVVASNRTSLVTQDGDTPDWVELYNSGTESVDLSGWSVTDDLTRRCRWVFPEGSTIAPGEHLVLYASKDTEGMGYRLGFTLDAEGGKLYLLDSMGCCADAFEWKNLDHDMSCSLLSNGKTSTDYEPSPGSENALTAVADAEEAERDERARQLSENDENIYINEVVCSMSKYSDWVELYNASDAYLDLSGWWLSDKNTEHKMWAFPEGTGIAAKGYLVIWLGGEEPKLPEGRVSDLVSELTLSLSDTLEDTENILLSLPDGTLVDRIRMKNQRKDVSYGRAEGYDTYRYFTELTPGEKNAAESYGKCAGEVEFSTQGGTYEESEITLTLSTTDGCKIYYTTDGSKPGSSSNVYSEPLKLSKTTVLRVAAGGEDVLPTDTVTRTFIPGRKNTLRTVCVTGKSSDLTGSSGALNTGDRTAVAVNVEIYDYDGTLMIDQGCALALSGKSSRIGMPQKAFKLKAISSYGGGKFKAKLFTNRDYTEYDSILLRASGQDMRKSHMRDSILTSLAADTSVAYQETELAAVFINGKYWGMYNMRENMNEDCICQYEGWVGDNDDINILSGSEMKCRQGSRDTYTEMIKFVKNHSMADDANLETLSQWVDIDNYIDFVCLMVYIDHEDLGNVLAYSNPNADGKWRWTIFDQDLSYLNDKNSMAMWLSSSGSIGSITTCDNTLFYELMKNASMRDKFLTRMGELLATTFSSANVQAKIEARYEAIKDEMVYSCERWDVGYETFQKQVKKLSDYAGTRTTKIIGYIKDCFDLSDAETQKYFGTALENEARTQTA